MPVQSPGHTPCDVGFPIQEVEVDERTNGWFVYRGLSYDLISKDHFIFWVLFWGWSTTSTFGGLPTRGRGNKISFRGGGGCSDRVDVSPVGWKITEREFIRTQPLLEIYKPL